MEHENRNTAEQVQHWWWLRECCWHLDQPLCVCVCVCFTRHGSPPSVNAVYSLSPFVHSVTSMQVRDVCFDPTGASVLAALDNKTTKAFDSETLKAVQTFTGHTDRVSDKHHPPRTQCRQEVVCRLPDTNPLCVCVPPTLLSPLFLPCACFSWCR